MFEQFITHHIAKSIVAHLTFNEYSRFSEMRPKKVDTNLFAYHLKALVRLGIVQKTEKGYTLGKKGLVYVDRVNAQEMKLRTQPKIITMLLVHNSSRNILLQKRPKQPHINTWTLPYGKLHIDDPSVIDAAVRESKEKLGYAPANVRHVGDCYIITESVEERAATTTIESRTLAHIARLETDAIEASERLRWLSPQEVSSLPLAPAVEQILAKTLAAEAFFFEEFRVPVR